MKGRNRNRGKTFKAVLAFFAAGAVVAILTFAGTAVYKTAKHSNYFSIKKVTVKGAIRSDKRKIEAAVDKLVGTNIFEVDLKKAGAVKDYWIMKLELKKVFPDRIEILVYEKRPILNVSDNGKCYIATAEGEYVPVKCNGVQITRDKDVRDEEFLTFLKIADENEELKKMKIELKEHYFVVSDKGTSLKFSYDSRNFEKQYKTYTSVIKKRYKSIDYADLRVSGKIFVDGVLNVSG